jgi:hypothetical protein
MCDAAHASRDEAAAAFLTNSGTAIRVARAFPGRVRDGRGITTLMSTGLGSVADVTDNSSGV